MSPLRRACMLLCVTAVGLAAAGCTVGVGTPPDEYDAGDGASADTGGGGGQGQGEDPEVDLLVEGPQVAVDDLAETIGGENIQAYTVELDTQTAFLETLNRDDPAQVDRYKWDAADGVTLLGSRPLSGTDLEPFPLNSVDFTTIPGLVVQASGLVQGQVDASVQIRVLTEQQIAIIVSVITPRDESAGLIADADGQVLDTT